MDVAYRIRSSWPILLAACLHLSWCGRSLADPMYTAIDLGSGSPTFGVDSIGNGTVTGANGLTYPFNPVQNSLPAQWQGSSQNVPNVVAPPVNGPDTYGNPAFAYSHSTLWGINSQGLAAGIDDWGVAGHIDNKEAFAIQQQPNGSWGTPVPLWAGLPDFGGANGVGILGISANGQILGSGYNMGQPPGYDAFPTGYGLFLYDAKSHSFTNLSNLIDSTMSPAKTNWYLNMPLGQIDNEGRILLSQDVNEGFSSGPGHTLLLIPQGLSPDAVPAPEPATWAVFAILLGGWMARRRLRSRADRK
jgi:hypothetical protein